MEASGLDHDEKFGRSSEVEDKSETTTKLLAKTWLKQYFHDSNFPEWTKTQSGITVPLTLPERPPSDFGQPRETSCLMCSNVFPIPEREKDFLSHLMEVHSIVIGDTHTISDLPAYIAYWKNKFSQRPMTEFCTVMNTKVTSIGEGGGKEEVDKQFYFLSDVLHEDKELRIHLQMKKLEQVLEIQESERKDEKFSRTCLFCRTQFEGRGQYTKLFDHMAFDHNFSVGQPDNLVYINELLDLLDGKLANLACIYCEKTFKTRDVLKEHMRKKGHKKINPKNVAYDRFYLVNYLEFGKTWQELTEEAKDPNQSLQTEADEELSGLGFESDEAEGVDDGDWSDWRGDLSGAVCLFCTAIYTDINDLINHMNVVHSFNYLKLRADMKLGFYQQIKLINFIRRQMHLCLCIHCSEKFQDRDQLFEHMKTEDHLQPPKDSSEWDQPQYFFPTYENDHFLYCLEDTDNDKQEKENSDLPPIIAEEIAVKDSILMEEEFRHLLSGSRTAQQHQHSASAAKRFQPVKPRN